MAVPTTSEFLLRFPEFGEQSTSVVEGALSEASDIAPESTWGVWQYKAVSYLAAHLLAIRTMQIGNQVGTLSGTPLGEELKSTQYGQTYKALLGSLPITGFAI